MRSMDESIQSPASHPGSASQGLIRLQGRLTASSAWLGPAWAALAGVVASGGFDWRAASWLRLILLILLVDGGWGTLWAALAGADWHTPLKRWRSWDSGKALPAPPYTLPGTHGARVSSWLGQLRAWWREELWPACKDDISALIVALPVTAAASVLLGVPVTLLSVAALAVMQIALVLSGGGRPPAAARPWGAILAVLFPWLAGHAAFAPLATGSAGLALAFTLARGGAWRTDSPWGRGSAVGAQLAAAGLLIVLHRPLAGGLVAMLLVPQIALLAWVRAGRTASWALQRMRPWLMAAMLIAAWAL